MRYIWLEIRVVSTCVKLSKISMHVKNWKIKNQHVYWFGLTELNKTKGIICGRKCSKTYIAAFLFLPSICIYC